jgi:hypothetical protein
MLANKFNDHLAMLMSVTQTFDDHLVTLLPVDEFDDHLALPNIVATTQQLVVLLPLLLPT